MEIAVTLPLHEGFSLSSAVKRLPILYPGLSLGKAAGGFVSLVFPAGWAMWEVQQVLLEQLGLHLDGAADPAGSDIVVASSPLRRREPTQRRRRARPEGGSSSGGSVAFAGGAVGTLPLAPPPAPVPLPVLPPATLAKVLRFLKGQSRVTVVEDSPGCLSVFVPTRPDIQHMCDFLLKRCGVNANTPGGAVSVIARPELVPSASTGQSHLYNGYLSPYNRMLDRAWLPLNGGAPVAQQSRSERRARKARLNVRAGGPGQPSTGAVSSCSSENGEDVPGGGSDDVSSASDSEAGASSRQPAAEAVAAAEGGAAFEDARGGGGLQPVEERGGQSGAEGRRGSRMREGRRSSGVFSDLALNSEVLMLLSPPLVPPTLLPLVHSPPAPAAAAGGSSLLADELAGTGGSPQPAAEDPMFSRVRSRSVDVRRASLTPLTAVVESGALAPAVASAARVGGASAGGASSSSNLPPASTASASAARSNGSDVAAAVAQLRKELAALSAAPDGGPGGSHASGGDAAASSAASRQDAVTLLRAEAAHALQREVGELREWLAAERERLQQDVQARQSSSAAPTAGSVVFGGRDGKSAARVPARSVEERQRAATITRDIADLCSRLQRASRSAAGKRPATLAANVRQPLLLTEEGRAFIANLPPALKTQSQLFATVPQPRCLLTRLV